MQTVITEAAGSFASSLGRTSSVTWTFSSPCSDGTCDATVQSSSGLTLNLINSGGHYHADRAESGDCVDSETEIATGQKVRDEFTYEFDSVVTDGTVVSLTGESISNQVEPCDRQVGENGSSKAQFTIVRTGP